MERKQRLVSALTTLALVGLNLVAFNALLSGTRAGRLDLTEDGLYSITPATKRLLTSLDEDVHIHGYFSQRTHPKLQPLVPQLVDLLEEYRAIGGGRIKLEISDPGENEAVEQEASSRFGVQSTPFRLASKYESGIVNAYFSLVVQHADQYVRYGFDDLIRVEPTPDGDIDVRLRNPEYDLTRAVKKVVFGYRATTELFERVEEPVRFTAVMTPDALPEVLQEVPQAVRDAAAQLAETGGDKFVFEEIDPSGDEALQQQLYERFGARPMTLGLFGGDDFYLNGYLQTAEGLEQFNLVGEGVNAASIRETIEDSLRRGTPGFLKTVGVAAPSPSIPPELMMQMQMQGRMPPQQEEFRQVQRYLERDYRVRKVDLEQVVPTEVDVLLVLQPTELGENAVFHLDQYLMRGGRVIVCAGKYKVDWAGQQGLDVRPVRSGLDEWLAHFGLKVEDTLLLDDRNRPLPVPEYRQSAFGTVRTLRMAPYPYLVEVRDDGLVNKEVAGPLGAMALYWPSPVDVDEEALGEGVESLEILRSSVRSWTDSDTSGVGFIDYEVPAEGLEPHPLAVALNGRFESFYKDRPAPTAAAAAEAEGDDSAPELGDTVLERSPETRLVLIGDAEFVNDFVADMLGLLDSGYFSENLAFTQNLIDWVNLDNDMISIRARGAAVRRLDEVDKSRQVTVEIANYLLPLAALLFVGLQRLLRRRRVVPVVAAEERT